MTTPDPLPLDTGKFYRIELLMPFVKIVHCEDEKKAVAFANAIAAQAYAQFGVKGILREISEVQDAEIIPLAPEPPAAA